MQEEPATKNPYHIPGDVPVVSTGNRLVALHASKNKAGEPRFSMSEVVPVEMNGREVAAWTSTFGGLRLTFDTPVECEKFLQLALTAVRSLKQQPRAERALDA